MNARSKFRRWVGLGLALGALATPAAQATIRPDDRAGPLGVNGSTAMQSPATRPDDRAGTLGIGATADTWDALERYLKSHGVRPDDRAGMLGVGTASVALPDVLERYAAAHPYGRGRSAAVESNVVGRPPDVSDAAETAKTASLPSSGGFQWGEYGAGVGTGIGGVLLLAGGLTITSVTRRRRTQTT